MKKISNAASTVIFSTKGGCPCWDKANRTCSAPNGPVYCGNDPHSGPSGHCPYPDVPEDKKQHGVPSSYSVQNGCWNCQHKYVWIQQDEDVVYYCHVDKSKRPLSDTYDESHVTYMKNKGLVFGRGNKKKDQQYYKEMTRLDRLWRNWAKKHLVQESGICSKHLPIAQSGQSRAL